MARGPNEKQIKAEELYRQGKKLVDIANELDVPSGTVRRWKSIYKWDGEQKSERSDKKRTEKSERSVKKQANKQIDNKPVIEEVEQVIQNSELTDKQRLFCLYFIKSFNATRSYQKAYGCDYRIAEVAGPRLLGNVRVKAEIERLKRERYAREFIREEDIFQKYMDIAFSDITDYITFGKKWVEARDGSEIEVSYVDLKDSAQVDGTLISEVTQGRDGIKIKLVDKQQALKWLSDHMDLATEEQKLKMAVMKKNAQGEDEEEIADDGFLDALNSSAKEDWSDNE